MIRVKSKPFRISGSRSTVTESSRVSSKEKQVRRGNAKGVTVGDALIADIASGSGLS